MNKIHILTDSVDNIKNSNDQKLVILQYWYWHCWGYEGATRHCKPRYRLLGRHQHAPVFARTQGQHSVLIWTRQNLTKNIVLYSWAEPFGPFLWVIGGQFDIINFGWNRCILTDLWLLNNRQICLALATSHGPAPRFSRLCSLAAGPSATWRWPLVGWSAAPHRSPDIGGVYDISCNLESIFSLLKERFHKVLYTLKS